MLCISIVNSLHCIALFISIFGIDVLCSQKNIDFETELVTANFMLYTKPLNYMNYSLNKMSMLKHTVRYSRYESYTEIIAYKVIC
jgi:hypothetical protein